MPSQKEYRAMPRKEGETPSQWMARVQAAREYINRVPVNGEKAKELELSAFLALFYPEIASEKRQQMVRNAYR